MYLSESQITGPWFDIVVRLHSGRVSENMVLMKDILLQDETRLSAIQRHILFGIVSFIATVYRNSYVFEHFDYLLYQQKAHRLMQVSTSSNHDFDILSDPDSEEHKLLMTLPPHLATSISVGGFRDDITPNIANELVDDLESNKFREFLYKILGI